MRGKNDETERSLSLKELLTWFHTVIGPMEEFNCTKLTRLIFQLYRDITSKCKVLKLF